MAREHAHDYDRVAIDGDTHRYRTTDDTRTSGAYHAEHWLAWLMAAVAIGLTAVGLLVGFGMLGTSDLPAEAVPDAALNQAAAADWQQGLLWLLPAIAVSMLAFCLHNAEHHTRAAPATSGEKSLFGAEHALAYLGAAVTLAGATLAILTGFDLLDNGNTVFDGYLWAVGSIAGAVLTATLHSVRHHQPATARDEDYIVRVVEDRIRMMPTDTSRTGPVVRERPIEH